mmetsp:Transcript_132674/g.424534  ORF Transcript_132674/g.424534 Transcript_132674/m.424534 type:complete len:324 (+) Transcript_132674:1456-2427(+)
MREDAGLGVLSHGRVDDLSISTESRLHKPQGLPTTSRHLKHKSAVLSQSDHRPSESFWGHKHALQDEVSVPSQICGCTCKHTAGARARCTCGGGGGPDSGAREGREGGSGRGEGPEHEAAVRAKPGRGAYQGRAAEGHCLKHKVLVSSQIRCCVSEPGTVELHRPEDNAPVRTQRIGRELQRRAGARFQSRADDGAVCTDVCRGLAQLTPILHHGRAPTRLPKALGLRGETNVIALHFFPRDASSVCGSKELLHDGRDAPKARSIVDGRAAARPLPTSGVGPIGDEACLLVGRQVAEEAKLLPDPVRALASDHQRGVRAEQMH